MHIDFRILLKFHFDLNVQLKKELKRIEYDNN